VILSHEQQSSPCPHDELGTSDFALMNQDLISMRATLSSTKQPEELGNMECTTHRARNKHPLDR
jgi:hypothetical protein